MAGVFSRTNEVNNHPKRNTFPLSFQNNLSGKFGVLYPCLVQDVIPGFTFKAKPTFALEFMPTAFPVQTRMRARMHFFYVRNRNLWKDFADFYGKTKEVLFLLICCFRKVLLLIRWLKQVLSVTILVYLLRSQVLMVMLAIVILRRKA